MADETGQDAAQIAAAQPWPYRANRPQRYSSNYPGYVARGGAMRPHEDVQGFTAGGMNRDDMARFYFFSLAFDQICKEEVAGDLAELGVYKGHTATLIATMARRLGRTAWLFDTFEGFSERTCRASMSLSKGQRLMTHRLRRCGLRSARQTSGS